MSLNYDVRQLNKQYTVSENNQVTAKKDVSVNIPMASNNALCSNIDSYNNNASSNIKNNLQRSEEELYKAFQAICSEYGINIKELKENALIEQISGLCLEKLLNISNSEIKKLIECFKAALDKVNFKSGNVDIKDAVKLAKDYNIAIHTGWTIEGFENAQKNNKHESLMDRLSRVYPGLVKAGKVEEALDKYFNNYFDTVIEKKLASETDPAKREKIIANEKARQLQDFGRLLVNSSDDEKAIFKQAIKSLYVNNRLKGLEVVVHSFDTDVARTEFVDSCSPKYIEEIAETADRFGDKSDKDEISGIARIITENQSETGRTDFHKEFEAQTVKYFEENKEIIERIYKKIENEEELTAEEKAVREKLDNYYTAVSSGEIIGTANNQVISAEFKNKFLETLNKDAYQHANYRDVFINIHEYIENPNNTLSMPKDSFEELMDKATNSNYSTIKNDEKNNIVSELNQPIQQVVAETTKKNLVNESLGFKNAESINIDNLANIKEIILNNQSSESKCFRSDYEVAKENYETLENAVVCGATTREVKAMAKHDGATNRALATILLNTKNASTRFVNWGLQLFSYLCPSIQNTTYAKIDVYENKKAAAKELTLTQREQVMLSAGCDERKMLEDLNDTELKAEQ